MGRAHKLTQLQVDKAKVKGVYGDGGGLSLNVTAGGSKSWLFRFMQGGRAHWMGLGSYPDVTLADARDKASECRKMLRNGEDPLIQKRMRMGEVRAASAKYVVFDECAAKYIEAQRSGWKNPKSALQWESSLKVYASPVIGKMAVGLIETSHILKIIEPIWTTKTETASRVRGRIEQILDWSKARGYRTGDNPASWRGHLDKILPERSKVRKVQHFAALDWRMMKPFMDMIRRRDNVSARCLEFCILTNTRSNEARGATWFEFDFTSHVWTIPAERMKSGVEHRVPLSEEALKIVLDIQSKVPHQLYVFTSRGGPLSDVAVTKQVRAIGELSATVHGFRSTFRDWAGETTDHQRETIEHAMAHRLKDKAEASYARGSHFEKRRALMNEWAAHCDHTKAPDNLTSPKREDA
jgi:integrase